MCGWKHSDVRVRPRSQKYRPRPRPLLSNNRRPRTVSIRFYQQQCQQCTLFHHAMQTRHRTRYILVIHDDNNIINIQQTNNKMLGVIRGKLIDSEINRLSLRPCITLLTPLSPVHTSNNVKVAGCFDSVASTLLLVTSAHLCSP